MGHACSWYYCAAAVRVGKDGRWAARRTAALFLSAVASRRGIMAGRKWDPAEAWCARGGAGPKPKQLKTTDTSTVRPREEGGFSLFSLRSRLGGQQEAQIITQ